MLSADSIAQSEPTVATVRHWNRWRTTLVLLFAVGMLLALLAQKMASSTVASSHTAKGVSQDRVDESIPNAALTPEQVVAKQMESLRAAMKDNDRLIDCYSLAAPSNRLATGPFENFSGLVRTEPYIALGLCLEYQVGAAVIDGDVAAVLVSLLTQRDQSMAFRFVLVKQNEVPYVDCWMTEGVFHLGADSNTTLSDSAVEPGQKELSDLSQESRID